jgi:hypothetical protein
VDDPTSDLCEVSRALYPCCDPKLLPSDWYATHCYGCTLDAKFGQLRSMLDAGTHRIWALVCCLRAQVSVLVFPRGSPFRL